MTNSKVSIATLARTAALAFALANQVSSAAGKPLLPIESSEVEQFVTTGLTIATSVAAWWKNNSFTAAAIEGRQADEQPEESGPLNERSNRV